MPREVDASTWHNREEDGWLIIRGECQQQGGKGEGELKELSGSLLSKFCKQKLIRQRLPSLCSGSMSVSPF